uniref:Putative tpa exp: sulfotransferase n=1 Tax=Amblyomma triste TaxID=251400 RepID=A0A023GI78_AMBTT
MDESSYRNVEGLWMHEMFHEEAVRSAMKYRPRDGDIFIVSYPKCGTYWTQFIVFNILRRAEPVSNVSEYGVMCPFIDMAGGAAAENPSRSGPIMTHLPVHVLRPESRAKYIYVARNPYDCVVSYYNFFKGFTPKTVGDVSFQKFLDMFLSGKVSYGDYFDQLLPWYNRRDDSNVLFVTYEDIKTDTRAQILKIADFLGEDHGSAMREDAALLENVMRACSIENMKALFTETPLQMVKRVAKAWDQGPSTSSKWLSDIAGGKTEMHGGSAFLRKGIVGDWKNCFEPNQIARMKTWIAKKTQGSDVMELWKSFELP